MSNDRPMLAARQLRLAAKAALDAIPNVTVLSPGDWNAPADKLPIIKLRNGTGRKAAKVRGMPEFDSTLSLEIQAAFEGSTAEAAQDGIEALGYAIEQALLLNPVLISITQQVASVDCQFEISAEGNRHLAGMKMDIAFEVFEAFDPTATPPSDSPWPPVSVAPVSLTDITIKGDLVNVFDPAGTYTAPTHPSYTPTTAPRTTGPDGRDEVGMNIAIPT